MPSKSTPQGASIPVSWKEILFDGSTYYPQGGVETTTAHATWVNSVTLGENLKGWRQLLRDGENATTSLTGVLSSVRYQSGRIEWRSPIGVVRQSVLGGGCGLSVSLPSDPNSLNLSSSDSEALGKFVSKVVSARAALQGGVFIGELGQTLRMIRNPAQGLRRLVTDWQTEARLIRQGHRVGSLASRMRRVAQNLGDAWLEHAFGWKPLLNDIDGGCKALAESYVGRPLSTRRITASAETKSSVTDTSAIYGGGLAFWRVRERLTGTTMVIYRGALRIEARDPKTMDPALFGFSPEQFLPTAWELVPYSFLIDYFTNIGDIINGWSSLLVPLKWCNRTTRKYYQALRIADCNKDITNGWALQSCKPATVIATTTRVSRAKYNGTTVPDFHFRMPGSGSLRWLNLAALIASRGNDRSWTFD